jgi:hypothetical protein
MTTQEFVSLVKELISKDEECKKQIADIEEQYQDCGVVKKYQETLPLTFERVNIINKTFELCKTFVNENEGLA